MDICFLVGRYLAAGLLVHRLNVHSVRVPAGEMSVQIFCPSLYWVVCVFVIGLSFFIIT